MEVKSEYKDGVLHRDGDLPAIEDMDENKKEWYKHGVLHRAIGELSAVELPDGSKNGVLHRDDNLPAFIATNGPMKWYTNGEVQMIVYGKD